MRLALERSAPAIALALVGERAAREATRRARDAFLVDLITRPAPTPAEVTGQFRLAGLNPDRSYTVVVARPADAVDRARRSIEEIAFPSGTVVAEHGSRVIALIPGMSPAAVATAWVQPAENRPSESPIRRWERKVWRGRMSRHSTPSTSSRLSVGPPTWNRQVHSASTEFSSAAPVAKNSKR